MDEFPVGARCLHCKYDLRGLLQPVCPECGKAFDPANFLTYWHPKLGARRRARALRSRLKPPLFDCAVVVIVAAYVVFITSGTDVTRLSGFEPLWCLAIGAAGCRAGWRRITAVRMLASAGLQAPFAGRRRARCLLFVGAILVSALIYPWHTMVRFYLSFPAFEAVVQKNEPRPDASLVGLFHVRAVRFYPNGTVFFATDRSWEGYSGESGIVYAPQPDEFRGKPYRLHRPLAPNWWTGSFAWR